MELWEGQREETILKHFLLTKKKPKLKQSIKYNSKRFSFFLGNNSKNNSINTL